MRLRIRLGSYPLNRRHTRGGYHDLSRLRSALSASALALALAGGAPADGQILGCPGKIPEGHTATAELRWDDGSAGSQTIGGSEGDEGLFANRFFVEEPLLITHICVWIAPRFSFPGPFEEIFRAFVAVGDGTSPLGGLAPGQVIAEQQALGGSGAFSLGDYELVELETPIDVVGTVWVGVGFPSPPPSSGPGVGLTPGVAPQQSGQSFLGSRTGSLEVWFDFDELPIDLGGVRQVIRALRLEPAGQPPPPPPPPPPPGPSGPCTAAPSRLCLVADRFSLEVSWQDFAGGEGTGMAVPLTPDTGAFWFFDEDNVELMVKVIDGREANGHFWVFYGALTNVAWELRVTDTETGASRTYANPAGTFASAGDTEAF